MTIIGPDPAALTDAEIYGVALKLEALSQRIAGCPGEKVTREHLDDLDQVDRYLYASMRVQFDVLLAENNRRMVEDAAVMVLEVEHFLRDEADGDV